jgi:hypothetical protein
MKFVRRKKAVARAEKALRLKQVYNYATMNLSLQKPPNIQTNFMLFSDYSFLHKQYVYLHMQATH